MYDISAMKQYFLIIILKILMLYFSLVITHMRYQSASPKLMRNQIAKTQITRSIFHRRNVLDLRIKSRSPKLLVALLINSNLCIIP